jgi:hypothetical protein
MTDVPFAAVSAAALYCARSSWIVDDAECLLLAARRFVVAHKSVGIGAIANIPRASQTDRSDAMAE